MAASVPKKCDVEKLQTGSVLSRISYMTVVSKQSNGNVTVKNEQGLEWMIGKDIVEKECYTADQHSSTEKVTRTDLARLLQDEVKDTVFEVCFEKAPDAKKQAELLVDADLSTDKKRRKIVSDIQTGEERILKGHLLDFEHVMGRLRVRDHEAPGEEVAKTRLVDLRTIRWLTLRNKKYVLK